MMGYYRENGTIYITLTETSRILGMPEIFVGDWVIKTRHKIITLSGGLPVLDSATFVYMVKLATRLDYKLALKTLNSINHNQIGDFMYRNWELAKLNNAL